MRRLLTLVLLCGALSAAPPSRANPADRPASPPAADGVLALDRLAARVEVGDVVFIRVPSRLFSRIADATGSWTNHVGIVVDTAGAEPLVAESRVPLSGETTLARFVARSDGGKVAVRRLERPLTADEAARLRAAARAREGVLYDTGFDLHSRRQFCSRFVREVVQDATGIALGEVETFAALLARRPDADLGFWRRWYLGRIPWQRETVTPASVLASPRLKPVFDGRVALHGGA